MVSIGALGLSVLCVLAYMSTVRGECDKGSRTKLDLCVASFSTANLLNQSDRKDRIKANNMTCPTDILKDSCTSFGVMQGCVNLLGFPWGCEEEYNTELKNQDFQCTYLELGALCPNAEKISGASSVVVSFSLIAVSVAAAIFNRL